MTPLPAPFGWEGEHIAADLPGGRALFTSRRGGVSAGPYASLNLGVGTADTQVADDPGAVAANRRRVAERIGVPWKRIRRGRQVHGARVLCEAEHPDPVGADTSGRPPHPDPSSASAPEPLPVADGQATDRPGGAAAVLVADCLPVAMIGAEAVAMLHCGWRGLAAGIIEEGVGVLRAAGAHGRVGALIGPGAGPCCYEVGPEVHQALTATRSAGSRPASESASATVARGPRTADLKAVAAQRLADAGVDEIYDVALCTMCADPRLFFSHRRDRGVTGRQCGAVWRA